MAKVEAWKCDHCNGIMVECEVEIVHDIVFGEEKINAGEYHHACLAQLRWELSKKHASSMKEAIRKDNAHAAALRARYEYSKMLGDT